MSIIAYQFPLVSVPALKYSPASNLPGGPLSFYGVGAAFPIRLNASGGDYQVTQEEELVQASIMTILKTDVSERPLLVKNGIPFGTRIRRALFESAEDAAELVVYEIRNALGTWEPRIVVENVYCQEQATSSGGSQLNTVTLFRYRSTNRPDNAVVPFILQGGTST